jgi:hypothetical protein
MPDGIIDYNSSNTAQYSKHKGPENSLCIHFRGIILQ